MKKIRIIIICSVISLLIVSGVIIVFLKTNNTPPAEGSKKYYEQWSSNSQEDLAKKSLKEYLTIKNGETKENRRERLSKYFTDDSPVYDYKPENQNISINSVSYCEEQEGGNLCLLIKLNNQIYWETIVNTAPNKFKVYDLGIWDIE